MCPLSKVHGQQVSFGIERMMRDKNSLEMQLSCNFTIAEFVQNELKDKGFKVILFTEFKKLWIGVWK